MIGYEYNGSMLMITIFNYGGDSMQDLHSLCVDKSSCKAEMEKQKKHVHALTKDSFKKTFEKSERSNEEQTAKRE
jgi:hypothetical protein